MATKTYNPRRVIATFKGQQITGFADGTFVSATRNEDTFTLTVGSDGESARSHSPNKSGRVTFTLLQTSASNDVLQDAHDLDERTDLGTGPILIKDLSGRTLIEADEAWVTKPADAERSKEIGSVEWVIECAELRQFNGGN